MPYGPKNTVHYMIHTVWTTKWPFYLNCVKTGGWIVTSKTNSMGCPTLSSIMFQQNSLARVQITYHNQH